jgi:cyclic pyranopterin phosphate synthase
MESKQIIINEIRHKLNGLKQSLAFAILQRNLYLRISLLGNCNLNCAICHNEGAPKNGLQELDFCIKIMKLAFKAGFRRVQFTGGEPLLHPSIGEFIQEGKKVFDDVGITTNGILLFENLEKLITAGISRIHISLQVETLMGHGIAQKFSIPSWLYEIINIANDKNIYIRLNLPIILEQFNYFRDLIEELSIIECDIKTFAILPYGNHHINRSTPQKLYALVNNENFRRNFIGTSGRVELRDYRPPNGIRCINCDSFSKCLEYSRSLRLGADKVLRPCLASRKWDIVVKEDSLSEQFEEAALLSIDYNW